MSTKKRRTGRSRISTRAVSPSRPKRRAKASPGSSRRTKATVKQRSKKARAQKPARTRSVSQSRPRAKVRSRAPKIKPRKVSRPGAWWREPIPKDQLAIIQGEGAEEQRQFAIAQKRYELVERIKDEITTARYWSTEFTAQKGYSLDKHKIVRMPASRLAKLRETLQTIKSAQARPYVEFVPLTDKQRRQAIALAGEVIKGQRRFMVHVMDATNAKARWLKKEGMIEVVRTVVGRDKRRRLRTVEVYRRLYLFPRKPKSWKNIVDMTRVLRDRGMRTGFYRIYNSLHGPIGGTVQRELMLEELQSFWSTYSTQLAGTILGWLWTGDNYQSAANSARRSMSSSERWKIVSAFNQRKRQRLIETRLGTVKRCKKCKRKKCICPPPEFSKDRQGRYRLKR